MRIDNLTSIDYTVTNLNGVIHFTFTDAVTSTVIGEFRVQGDKGRSFLEILKTLFEQVYGINSAFDINKKIKADLQNKTSGNIRFTT